MCFVGDERHVLRRVHVDALEVVLSRRRPRGERDVIEAAVVADDQVGAVVERRRRARAQKIRLLR